MIQGMSARILERVNRAKTYKGNYSHKLFRNNAMICSVMIGKKDVFINVWTFQPITISQYFRICEIMTQFEHANTGKTIHHSIANLKLA